MINDIIAALGRRMNAVIESYMGDDNFLFNFIIGDVETITVRGYDSIWYLACDGRILHKFAITTRRQNGGIVFNIVDSPTTYIAEIK